VIAVELSPADLATTRTVPMAGPMAETVLALGVATGRRRRAVGGDWPVSAARRVGRAEHELARLLHPRPHVTLDVFTLAGPTESWAAGADRLLRADPSHVATEVRAISRAPQRLAGLADADPGALRRLTGALAAVYRTLVEPSWPVFAELLDASRRRLDKAIARDGIGAALAGLDRDARWEGSTLVLPHAGLWTDRKIHARLDGRGLVLAPTLMTDRPVPYFPLDPSEPVVLLCPVASPVVRGAAAPSARDLDRLVGRSRAAILRQLAVSDEGRSTSEVADLAHLSTPTASEHLTVLRGAGLVHSTRHGKRMVHTVTPLGNRLLGD
jgi:DNA-binding transcriptional ArsR family regulator